MVHVRWIGVFVASGVALCLSQPGAQSRVTVDREAHVSYPDAHLKMGETVLAAHPTDPNRLVGAGLAWLNGAGRRAVVAYTSTDGGVSWRKTFSTADSFFDASDETVAFAPDGTAYLLVQAWKSRDGRPDFVFYRSDDAGLSWVLTSRTATSMACDRQFLAVHTDGTIYVSAHIITRRADGAHVAGPAFFVSTDRGQSLNFVGTLPSTPPAQGFAGGNVVVSSDGTPVHVFNDADDVRMVRRNEDYIAWGSYEVRDDLPASVRILRATKWPRLDPIGTVARIIQPFMPFEGWAAAIAIDASSEPYKDRLYVVWPDRRSGRSRILSAFSSDRGGTWSTARAVDDLPDAASPQQSPNNFMPMVAVNRDGVVGVMWYDRRDDPTNRGWSIRFAASHDGGETWAPSVPVSSRPNTFDPDGFLSTTAPSAGLEVDLDDRQMYAADTVGLAAGADGSFHPLWIDNRTGIPQMWTARVRVEGKAIRNGSDDLKNLDDASARVLVITTRAAYRAGVINAELTVTNTSQDPIDLPAKLRVVSIESALGTPEIINADNGQTGTGALWDLAGYLPGGRLAPGETSKPLAIKCQLKRRGPLREGNLFHYGVLRVETVLLATVPRK